MKRYDDVSDERLNAFVDDQLDPDEKSWMFAAINEDEGLNRRACELRRLREMVRHTYDHPPAPPGRPRGLGRRRLGWEHAVAATLLLTLGATAGWMGHARSIDERLQATFLDEQRAFETRSLDQAPGVYGTKKVILHLSSAKPDKIQVALDTAENLLDTYRERHEPVELELVANAGGLNLLRADVSPYAQRVRELQRRFENLTFLACQTAIEKLRREESLHDVELLPEALTTPSALEEILTRMQQGWVYIKV